MNERRKIERSVLASGVLWVQSPTDVPRSHISVCTKALLRCHPLSIIKWDKSHSGGGSLNVRHREAALALAHVSVMLTCSVTSLLGPLNNSYWSINRLLVKHKETDTGWLQYWWYITEVWLGLTIFCWSTFSMPSQSYMWTQLDLFRFRDLIFIFWLLFIYLQLWLTFDKCVREIC